MRTVRTPIAAVMASLALGLPMALAVPPPQERPDDPVTAHAEPRWLKGNLHTHSFWSDGDDFPEMIADWYKGKGYQFLALTDHNVLSEGEKWIDQDRVAKTIEYLKSVKQSEVDGTEGKEIKITFPSGQVREFTGQSLLLGNALPNFYFHATTAYDIIRQCGVEVGKRDFMGTPPA